MFTPLEIPDVLLIHATRHSDDRGWFSESYSLTAMARRGLPRFVQDNEVFSQAPGTVRGLHFQRGKFAQAKLVRCVSGSIFDVAVDIRPQSKTFGRWVGLTIDAKNGAQVFVPVGFAHGYCTLEPNTLVQYKVSHAYAPDHEGGIFWRDSSLAIDWPIKSDLATLSDRDMRLPAFHREAL